MQKLCEAPWKRKESRLSENRNGISVVANGAPAKSFLLKGEAFVEHLPALFGGNAKVEEAETLLAVTLDEVVEKKVERTHLAPCGTGADILRMHYGIHLEKECSRHYAAVLMNRKEAYVGGVVANKPAQFIQCVDWGNLMASPQVLIENLPECWQIIG